MDQEERCDRIETSKNSSRIAEILKNSINGIVSETVIVKNSEENADLGLQNDDFGLCKHQGIDSVKGIDQESSQNDWSTKNSSSLIEGNVVDSGVVSSEGLVEANETRVVDETLDQIDQRSENSDNSIDGLMVETNIVISTLEAACVNEKPTRKVLKGEDSCVIDMNERVCRICHLNSEQSFNCTDYTSSPSASTDLIQLGCVCKDELGIAHSHCAEAWFKLKGNRMCEICGQTAKNVTGVRDNRFIEDWHEQGSLNDDAIPSDRGTGCWRGQPFCNFLMACLVIAFVLPWFFHVNMF